MEKTEIKVEFISSIINLCVTVNGKEYNYCETEGGNLPDSGPNPSIQDENGKEIEDEALVKKIIYTAKLYERERMYEPDEDDEE